MRESKVFFYPLTIPEYFFLTLELLIMVEIHLELAETIVLEYHFRDIFFL